MPINSYEDMKEKKSQIMHLLVDLAGIVDNLNEIGLSINGTALLDLKKKLENDNFKVLVIGEFKNGKSTFINSLMGEKILPAYSTPCTAVINEVVYGKDKRAVLFLKILFRKRYHRILHLVLSNILKNTKVKKFHQLNWR